MKPYARLWSGAVLAITLCAPAPSHAAGPPEIWFAPMQDAANANGKGVNFTSHDFPAMVSSLDGWKNAAHRIAAIELNTKHIVEAYPDLPAVVRMVNAGGFKVIGGGSVLYSNGECKPNEGMNGDHDFEHENVGTLSAWHDKGGRLDILSMDGPFFFGLYAAKDCHFSIEEVARRAANTVNRIAAFYPNVAVLDVEGPGPVTVDRFLPDYAVFLRDFNRFSHRPITQMSLDMHWIDAWHTGYRWVEATRKMANFAHNHGLKIGLLMDAEDNTVESADGTVIGRDKVTLPSWMQMVRAHIALAHREKLPLDHVEIVSWMKFPRRNLPETDPNAMASLVDDAWTVFRQP